MMVVEGKVCENSWLWINSSMKISIRRNSDYVVEFNRVQIQGRRGLGGFTFVLVLEGSSKPQQPAVSVSNISISLTDASTKQALVFNIPSSTQLMECIYAMDEQLCFELLLSKEQLNAIEEHRGDGDLKWQIGLRAMASRHSDSIYPSYDSSTVAIPRQEWLRALSDTGYRDTLMFEIPMPSFSDDLMDVVTKAQEFIDCGHYQEAVMQCRRIIERVEERRGDGQKSRAASKRLQNSTDRKEMSAEDRMLCMREQVKNICQLGAHGESVFTRSQARAVLGLTLTLLAEPTVGFCQMTPKLNVAEQLVD